MKPKSEIIIERGIAPSSELLAVLLATCTEEEVQQAITEGAKITLTLTTPWPKPKKPKAETVIEPALLDELHRLTTDSGKLEARIAELNGPQILKIGEILGIPMQKSAKTEGLRARLFGSLRSEAVWKGISGQGGFPVRTDSPASTDTQTSDTP